MPADSTADLPWLEAALPGLVRRFGAEKPCAAAGPACTGRDLPGNRAVAEVLDTLVDLVFPDCHSREPGRSSRSPAALRERLVHASSALDGMIARTLAFQCRNEPCRHSGDCTAFARKVVAEFIDRLADTRAVLAEDIQAGYEGDPAARSTMEVAICYPGAYAIAVHRIAHILHVLGVPILPRMMSEHAHSRTGIDIHPGASIGSGFFIDHGTGVVIGETCVIGRRVKLYQGVTLGALSFAKDADGNLVKGVKRHPDVEDNVVVYAGATILGGDTRIGHDSVIGGNVWLTHSVPPYSKVYNRQPEPRISSSLVWEGPMI